METTTITSKKADKFLKEISVDENFWKTWIKSPACFLGSHEIIVINGFILTGDHYYASTQLDVPYDKILAIFCNCKRHITWSYHVFQKWLTRMLLEEYGMLSPIPDSDFFLYAPIKNLVIEYNLKQKLMPLNDTVFGLLSEYSEKDLKTLGLGSKDMKDFKSLLIENNCLHLLKDR